MKKLTQQEFIDKAIKIHGDKYDYSLVNYIGSKIKVKIICKIHGIFEQTPCKHMVGDGCKKCGIISSTNKQSYTKEEFIKKAIKIHKNYYDYSVAEYINSQTKVNIICPEHGIFEQKPANHLQGQCCKICSINKLKTTIDQFINKANIVHNNKYDYSLVDYVDNKTKIKIVCTKHGTFEQRPNSHLNGDGCYKCGLDNNFLTTEEFIRKSLEIQGNKYDYSLVEYIDNQTKVKIICPVHGVFEQKPCYHSRGCGCQKCKESKSEKQLSIFFDKYSIKYIQQKKFDNCKDKRCLPFDFFLPEYNICVEYDGEQHFRPNIIWGN